MNLIKVTSDSLDLNTLLKRAKNSVLTVEKHNFSHVLVEKAFYPNNCFHFKMQFFFITILITFFHVLKIVIMVQFWPIYDPQVT